MNNLNMYDYEDLERGLALYLELDELGFPVSEEDIIALRYEMDLRDNSNNNDTE